MLHAFAARDDELLAHLRCVRARLAVGDHRARALAGPLQTANEIDGTDVETNPFASGWRAQPLDGFGCKSVVATISDLGRGSAVTLRRGRTDHRRLKRTSV